MPKEGEIRIVRNSKKTAWIAKQFRAGPSFAYWADMYAVVGGEFRLITRGTFEECHATARAVADRQRDSRRVGRCTYQDG